MSATSIDPSDTAPDAAPDIMAKRPVRRRATILIGIGGVIAIGAGVVAIDRSLSDSDREVATFGGPISSVVIDVSGGSVTLVGSDDPTVGVDVNVESGLRRPTHHESLEDGRLLITSHCPVRMFTLSCSTDYVVRVPEDVTVELDGDGVDADVSGITGYVDAAINGGSLDLAYDIVPPGLEARAIGGDIDIVVPDDGSAGYRVDASSNGGSTEVMVRSDPTSDRVIDLHTNGGSISVTYAPST